MTDARKIVAKLADETAAAAALKDALIVASAGEDEFAIALEGETNLIEALTAAVAQIDADETHVLGIAAMIEKLKARKARLENRKSFVRAAIEQAMDIGGLDTQELASCTLTLSARGTAYKVTDEAQIASMYWKQPPPVLDKAALNAACKARQENGLELPLGVVLANKPRTLTIRRD